MPSRTSRPVGWITLLGSLLLSACAQPEVTTPAPADVPPAFSAAGSMETPPDWWTVFEEEELDALVAAGLEGNPGLAAAWARLDRARAVTRSVAAELRPMVDLRAGAGREWGETAEGFSTESTSFSLGVAASYEVDLWGRIASGVRAAEYEVLARRGDLRSGAISLSAAIVETWFLIAELRARLDLIEDQIATNEDVLSVLDFRFRRGQIPAEDVLRQRQLVEAREGDRARARGALAVLEHRLAILVGRPPGRALPSPSLESATLPPLPRTGLPAELVRRRPDLRASWFRIAAAESRVAEAVAATYPRLSLSGSADSFGEDLGDLLEGWSVAVAANLVEPLVDGGRREAEVEAARAEAMELFALHRESVLVALSEVEDALVEEARQRDFLDSVGRQLELARQVMDQARSNYRNGVTDYLGVLDATRTYQELQREALGARLDLFLVRIALHRALAGGFEIPAPEGSRS